MKKLIIIAMLITTANLSAQLKSLPDAIIKGYVFSIEGKGLTKIYNKQNERVGIDFVKNNIIEIDGHLIIEPIYFKIDLNGIEIYDKNKKQYQKRKCENEKCNIIHLEAKSNGTSLINGWLTGSPNKILLNNNN